MVGGGTEDSETGLCTITEGCTLEEGHEGECILNTESGGNEPENEDENVPGSEAEGEKDPVSCTLTEGCVLEEGHTGECSVPATMQLAPKVPADDGINTPEEFKSVLEQGGTVTLSGSITLEEGTAFSISKEVVIDLNGNSITREGESSKPLFSVNKNGVLTLNDAAGAGGVYSSYPFRLYSGSQMTVNGGTVISSNGAALDIYTSASDVKVEINGGTFSVKEGNSDNVFGIRGSKNVVVDIKGGELQGAAGNRLAMYVSGDKDEAITLNISGGSVKSEGQAIQAYSGAVINVSGDALIHSERGVALSTQSGYGVVELNMTGGSFSHNVKDYVPQGMTVEQGADGSFIVTKLKTVYAGGSGAADTNSGAESGKAVKTLKKALELVEEGGTVIVQGQLEIKEDMALDKVTIKRGFGCTGNMLYVSGSYTLTLKNVTIDGNRDEVSGSALSPLVYVHDGATLNIEDGSVLKNNAFAAVRGDDQSEVNMSGGIITGNASKYDGGGILMYGGTLNLTGGEISGNSSERAGGGVCYLGKGTVNLSGTKILKNSANCGGGVYIEGMNGEAVLTMTGGEIRENSLRLLTDPDDPSYHWLQDGAGICAWGNNDTDTVTKVIVRGGIISDNIVTNDQAEDPGVGAAISLNHTEERSHFPELTLGGNPVIDGDIALWDEETAGPVIQVEEGFAHEGPIEVWVNCGTEGVTAARFPNTMTAAEAEALFSSKDKKRCWRLMEQS